MQDVISTEMETDTEAVSARPTDEQDRVEITYLTDREIAEETLTYLRLMTDLLTEASKSPLVAPMMRGITGFGKR